MDYSLKMKGLLKEVWKFPQYKRMELWVKIIIIFFMIPLIISVAAGLVIYNILLFFYNAITSPLHYLHEVIRKEGDHVKPLAQAAIYLICFPIVFVMYITISFLSLVFYFLWFGLMLDLYLLTLGGIKWQPYISDAKYEEEVEYEYTPGQKGQRIFAITLAACFAVTVLCILIFFVLGYTIPDILTMYADDDYIILLILIYIAQFTSIIFLNIVNPCLFRKHKVDKEEELVEELDVEFEELEE